MRSKYDVVSGKFFGIEYCVTFITTRYNQDEQFFHYGYHKDNSKVLYWTRKLKIPNSFKTTIFERYKALYESGAFDEQEFSKLYFYLQSTVDRNEKINKYLTSVHLKPFDVDSENFGEKFNPADPDSFNRESIVSYIKESLSRVLRIYRETQARFYLLLLTITIKLLWPGGKRTQSHKFALTY